MAESFEQDASACLCCHGTPFCDEDPAVCVCVCVCWGQGNTVLFSIAVVRSEDASVCLCCQGTLVWPVSSTFSLSMESKVVFSADMEGFGVRVGDSKVCTRVR